MTPYERGQWLFSLQTYLVSQRKQMPDAFADQHTLFLLSVFLQMAYWDAGGIQDTSEIADADFQRWLLTLWPAPLTA